MERVKVNSKQELEELIEVLIKNRGVNVDLNFIDVSGITDMSYLFFHSNFNGNISQWDVSNVTTISRMFDNSHFNGDISQWDVSNVRDMSWAFSESKFNSDITGWNVSKVKNMTAMFSYTKFKGGCSSGAYNDPNTPGCQTASSYYIAAPGSQVIDRPAETVILQRMAFIF
jgi:surface protein